MRVSFISILALSGLSVASPVLDRRADALSVLNDLFATIQTYTGAINATLAPLSADSPDTDKTAAITDIGASFTSITDAISSSTTSIKTLTPGCSAKRSPLDHSLAITEKRQSADIVAIGAALTLILIELFATITGAVAILGLSGLLLFLNPLTGSLGVLILAVEGLVDSLLIAVIVLLDSLLTGLALGLGGL